MNFTPTPVFYAFIALMIGMAIGWAIGYFDSNARSSKKIQDAEANAEAKIKEAEKKIALASEPSKASQDNPGLLRLKNDGGRFMIEMDGMPVSGLLSPEKKKRLIELITVLRPLLEGGQLSQSVPQPVAPVQTPPPAPVPVQPAVSRPVQPVISAAKKPDAEKNIKAMSIVNQIDTVLQARLADTPLAKRGIRLQESPQGGVEVYVGLEKFSTVDEVSDETIKNVIRAAIAEWEVKYMPGL